MLNANGEYSVRRGPLQYVMPIPHIEHKIKDYPVPNFFDYNLVPEDIVQAYQVIILDDAEELGLDYCIDIQADMNRPWDISPVYLKSDSQRLVPLGSTLLRRSTFPKQNKVDS